ncbi:uncharacterized protein LOC125663075 [Ostrea edulis]|uniref:uncharacterized protein LOC125663075 n=1 Tax=Ostrea edulis TaxID=37623 RepID=UPI0024AF5C93|nr:uncharacterized protein LOC125663075 [Ostrea edulis]
MCVQRCLGLLSFFFCVASSYYLCPQNVQCPPGCTKIDTRGCKLCACGPGMFHPGGYVGMPKGMMGGFGGFLPGSLGGGSPYGGIQGSKHVTERPLKECPGTMLCMMTCKGHYTLGDVASNGCRSCTCPTHHETTSNVVHVVHVQTASHSTPHHDCAGTKLCMMTCRTTYMLGERGSDGCQSCTCLPAPTEAPKPAPTKSCMSTVLCMLSCKTGYSLGATGSDGCQTCTCVAPPTQPPTTPAPKVLTCSHTIQCMLNCKQGYTLGNTGTDGCPQCACVVPTKVIEVLTCSKNIECNSGCGAGYKCGHDGCPTCECIKPATVGLTVVEIVKQPVRCTTAFSCPASCELGYKCGDDGCPTCQCLVAVTTDAKIVVPHKTVEPCHDCDGGVPVPQPVQVDHCKDCDTGHEQVLPHVTTGETCHDGCDNHGNTQLSGGIGQFTPGGSGGMPSSSIPGSTTGNGGGMTSPFQPGSSGPGVSSHNPNGGSSSGNANGSGMPSPFNPNGGGGGTSNGPGIPSPFNSNTNGGTSGGGGSSSGSGMPSPFNPTTNSGSASGSGIGSGMSSSFNPTTNGGSASGSGMPSPFNPATNSGSASGSGMVSPFNPTSNGGASVSGNGHGSGLPSPFNPGTNGGGTSSSSGLLGTSGSSSQTSGQNPLLPQFLQGNSGMEAHQTIAGLGTKPGNVNFNAGTMGGSLHQINTEQSIGHPVDTSQYNGQQTGILATNTNGQSNAQPGGNFSNPFTASGNGAFTNDGFKPSPFMQAAGQNGGKGPFAGSMNSGNGTSAGPFSAVGGNVNAGFSENTLPNPFQATSGTGGNTAGNGAATSGFGQGTNPFQATSGTGGNTAGNGAATSGFGQGTNPFQATSGTGGNTAGNGAATSGFGQGTNPFQATGSGGGHQPSFGGSSGMTATGTSSGGSAGGANKPNVGGAGGFNPSQGNGVGSSVGGNKPYGFGGGSGGGMGGGSPMGGGGNFHAPTGYGGATGGGPMMGGSAGGNPMAGSTNSGTGSKIDVQYVMKKCPNTMHCMTTCPQGYRLGGEGKDGCPLCTCLGKQGEVMQGLPHQNTLQGLGNLQKGKKTGKQTEQIENVSILCPPSFACPITCLHGYVTDYHGCPSCSCHVIPESASSSPASIECEGHFSCPQKCHSAYVSGSDGCPQCDCVPVAKPKPKPQPTHIDAHAILAHCPTTMNCMTSCKEGYTLGGTDAHGCPSCTCAKIQKTDNCHTGCDKPTTAVAVKTCDATITCMTSCEHGYTLGDKGHDGCPACRCEQKCTTCETHPIVIQKVDECKSGCEQKPVVVVQKTHECTENCHQNTGTYVAVGGSSGGTSGGSTGGGLGGGAAGGFSAGSGGMAAGGMAGGMAAGGSGGGAECRPLPPNCHPHCIKYDVAHCRKCMCESENIFYICKSMHTDHIILFYCYEVIKNALTYFKITSMPTIPKSASAFEVLRIRRWQRGRPVFKVSS